MILSHNSSVSYFWVILLLLFMANSLLKTNFYSLFSTNSSKCWINAEIFSFFDTFIKNATIKNNSVIIPWNAISKSWMVFAWQKKNADNVMKCCTNENKKNKHFGWMGFFRFKWAEWMPIVLTNFWTDWKSLILPAMTTSLDKLMATAIKFIQPCMTLYNVHFYLILPFILNIFIKNSNRFTFTFTQKQSIHLRQ